MPTGWMWQFNITCSGFFSHHLKCFQPLGASPERQSSLCQCWAAFTLSLSCLCRSCLIQVPWLCRRDTSNLWLFQWRKWRFGLSHGFLGHPIFWQTHILLSFSFSPYPAIGVHFDQENTFDIVDQSEVGDIPLRAPGRKINWTDTGTFRKKESAKNHGIPWKSVELSMSSGSSSSAFGQAWLGATPSVFDRTSLGSPLSLRSDLAPDSWATFGPGRRPPNSYQMWPNMVI